jgi:hypothetical protein
MQTRLQLLHSWTTQLQQLLPSTRLPRVRVLALFSLGLLWAESTSLVRIAASLPLGVQDHSTERRLRRWLANVHLDVAQCWDPLARALVARQDQREVLLVLDPTTQTSVATIFTLGLVVHRRALPLAWRVLPNQSAWGTSQQAVIAALCRRVAVVLPWGTTVTLVADSGLTSVDLVDLCRELGWHYVLRLSVDAQQGVHVRLADGTVCPAWRLVRGRGRRWFGTVQTFQAHGWRQMELSSVWPARHEQPWVLISDRPAGPARVREYRRRMRIEAFFEDCKSRGWDLERSKLTERARLDRLLLVVALASWWQHLLGAQVIKCGWRRWFDRTDRRDLSLARLGRRWMGYLLDRDHLPPLLFRSCPACRQWTCRWAF